MNKLGVEKIPKLFRAFAIPAIIANVVNALYNIVDQIFIGQGVGYLGNAATNIAFPITTLCLALGLMIGLGSAMSFNLALGRKKEQKARKIAASAVSLLFIIGIIITIIVRIFLKDLMIKFGATSDILEYAMTYTSITSLGIPFLLFSIGINPLVRADGSSTYSMFAILVGAILNTILDPLFIFVFKMGIGGAAIATVISQMIASIILLFYYTRFKMVKFEKTDFIPTLKITKTICKLGISAFIFQISNTVIQITLNNLLKKYGALSIYGSEIPIAVAGIVAKINVIFISIMLGLVQGAQPILSFNYGAKNYARVKETVKLLLKLSAIVSIVCFLIFELFPKEIIKLFGEGSEDYFIFAVRYMRIYMAFMFINGIQISITPFFSSIGKAKYGAFLSLTRQMIFLLPFILILPTFMGLYGLVLAQPISDLLSAVVAIIMLFFEIKNINKLEAEIST